MNARDIIKLAAQLYVYDALRYKENICFRSRVYATQKAIKQNYKNTRT